MLEVGRNGKRFAQMTQTELAKKARVSVVSLNYICAGERSISRKMAEDLETASGIAREAWMWPTRWWNPYIKTSSRLLPEADLWAGRKFREITGGETNGEENE